MSGIPQSKVSTISRDTMTAQQISTLLSVIGHLYPYVTSDAEVRASSPADGGAVMAATITMTRACDRLDSILADESRWNLDAQHSLEKSLETMYAANTAYLEQQRESSASVVKPSFRFRPVLLKIDEGWTAILGNLQRLDACIIGIGASPQAAIDDFDRNFAGLSTETVRQVVEQHEHTKTVDDGRDQTTESTPTAAHERKRNRKAPRKNKKVGGDAPSA